MGENPILSFAATLTSLQLPRFLIVGPAHLLGAHGIDGAHKLAVWGNLQDQFECGLEFRSSQEVTVNDLCGNPLRRGVQLLGYILFRTGSFADNGNYSITLSVRTAKFRRWAGLSPSWSGEGT